MGWMAGWSDRGLIGLPATTTDQTNLNFKLLLTYNSKMKSDFSDVRFVDSDGTTLINQFRESYVDGVSAIWWYQVPVCPLAGKTVYIYYGNASATLVSSGDLTFPFFDDFIGADGDSPDPTKWTTQPLPPDEHCVILNNSLSIFMFWGHLSVVVWSIATFPIGYGYRARIKKDRQGSSSRFGSRDNALRYYYSSVTATHRWYYNNNYTATSPVTNFTVLDIKRIANGVVDYYYNDNEEYTKSGASNSNQMSMGFYVSDTSASYTKSLTVDWAIVYKLPSDGTEYTDPVVGEDEEELETNFTWDPTLPVAGEEVDFTDTSTGGPPTAWHWHFGDTVESDEQNPSHTYATSGSFDVSLTASTSHQDHVETKSIEVLAVLDADFTYLPLDPVDGESISFTDTSTGETPTTWAWTFGDTETSDDQHPTHAYALPGTYSVTLTASTVNQSDFKTKSIVVSASIVADFSWLPLSPKDDETITFHDDSTGTPTAWDWDFGDDTAVSHSQHPTHAYANSGSYDVTLTSWVGEASDTVIKNIVVANLAFDASFTWDPLSPKDDETVTFTDTSAGETATAWTWYFGDGASSNLQHPTHVYEYPGVYDVTLVATAGAEEDSKVASITVWGCNFVYYPVLPRKNQSVAFTGSTYGMV